MLSELTTSSLAWTNEEMKELEAKLLFGKDNTHFVMCKNCFPPAFHWRWRSKDSVISRFERYEPRDKTSIADGDQKGYEVLIVFCVDWHSEEGALLGSGDGVWEVSWILNGFWPCQYFCWVMGLWPECKVLLLPDSLVCFFSLSIIVKSLGSAFGCFLEMWWFLMAPVVKFYGVKLFLQGPVGFTYVFKCAVVAGNFQW